MVVWEGDAMIRTQDDVERDLARLLRLDPRLEPVAIIAGVVPLRPNLSGLAGLAATVVAQQVSRASAEAILARLRAEIDLSDPSALLAASDEAFRRAGLSVAKQRTLMALAAALTEGRLDLSTIAHLSPDEAVAALCAVRGIGRWTAECHLLFSIGHPDIFPAGDLALRAAVGHALGIPERPAEKAVATLAAGWRPHRSVAARLFWAYYHAVTRRNGPPPPG